MDDRCRQREFLLHPVRIIRDHRFGTVGKLHEFQQFSRPAPRCRAVQTVHAPHKVQIFASRQALEKAHPLRHDADLPLHFDGMRCEILAEELHAAGGRCQQACQHLDGR